MSEPGKPGGATWVLLLGPQRPLLPAAREQLAADGFAVRSATSVEACDLVGAQTWVAAVLVSTNTAASAGRMCEQVRAAAPDVPILVLVDVADVAERVAILDSGASVVLEGGYAPAELIARLHALVRRRTGQLFAPPTPAPRPVGTEPHKVAAVAQRARGWPTARLLTVTLFVAATLLVADAAAKILVETSLSNAERLRPAPFITLVHADGGGGHGLLALALLIVSLPLIPVRGNRLSAWTGRHRCFQVVAAAAAIAASANLAQLAASGSVTDFLALPLLPTLNLADLIISLAGLMLVAAGLAKLASRHHATS